MRRPRTLVFCRAGEGSLHRQWIGDPATRSFDVWLDCYCDPALWAQEPAKVTDGRGTTKWLRLARIFAEEPQVFDPYDAIWFPDDDLAISTEAVESFLGVFHLRRLALAQPALQDGSFFSHELTLASAAFELRYTNFVEVMAPAFSRAALHTCAETFGVTRSGWGIDSVWGKLLGDPPDAIAIVDATPMVHTRPVGGGGLYKVLGIDPGDEKRAVTARYGVAERFPFRQYGGITRGAPGESRHTTSRSDFLRHLLRGAPRSQRWRAAYWTIMLRTLRQREEAAPSPPRGAAAGSHDPHFAP